MTPSTPSRPAAAGALCTPFAGGREASRGARANEGVRGPMRAARPGPGPPSPSSPPPRSWARPRPRRPRSACRPPRPPGALVHLGDDGVAHALQLLELVGELLHLGELVAVEPGDGLVHGLVDGLLVLGGDGGRGLLVGDGVPHAVGVVLEPVLGLDLL